MLQPSNPRDPETDRPDLDPQAPRPWLRFAARLIDTILFSFVFGAVLSLFFLPLVARLPEIVLGMAGLFAMTFAEAWFLSRRGTTPGKALLRTRVVARDGGLLPYAEALRRSFGVWLLGMGAGVPLVPVVTFPLAYLRLRRHGVTAWDEEAGARVEPEPPGPVRLATAAGLIALFVLLAVLAQSVQPG
jgi:uncharacterized RDD family membrane protein YckC